jgi:hypothetical protein
MCGVVIVVVKYVAQRTNNSQCWLDFKLGDQVSPEKRDLDPFPKQRHRVQKQLSP